MRGSMTLRDSIIRFSISHSEAISRTAESIIVAFIVFSGPLAFSQSLFLGGEYVLGNRAAGMSAYVADPDFAHAVQLNPAKLGYVTTIYTAADYEYLSRSVGELFLRTSPADYLANGRLSAWDASIAFPLATIGAGASFSAFDLAGWRTTISGLGVGVPLPLGFSLGVTGKYVSIRQESIIPGGFSRPYLRKFTFDFGAMNRTMLANTTFFRAILSSGIVFRDILPGAAWNYQNPPVNQQKNAVDLPQSFGIGVAYTFASNYRLYDFELFRVTGAIDYEHVFNNSDPLDDFISQPDIYRVGLETTALGVLAVRIGYTLKAPLVEGYDLFNNLAVARMGTGFSYGFSLRFPVKLVLPSLPVTSLEISYAKNPEWNSGMYHNLFGAVFELLF